MALTFPSLRMFVVSLLVSFGGSFHFGYQLVITNPSQDAFLAFVNESLIEHYELDMTDGGLKAVWSAVVSLLFVGAIVGCLALPFVAEKVGRKRGLYVSSVFIIISCVLSALSRTFHSVELFTAARLFFGFSLGLALGLASLYLAESSPKPCRGFVSMTTGTMLQFGIMIGAATAMPISLGTVDRWPLIYYVEIVPLVLLIMLLPFMDESPTYLVSRGQDEAARRSIRRFHACASGEVDKTLAEIKLLQKANAKSLSLIGVFKDRESRRGTLVACIVALAMGFSGIAVINAFVVQLFRDTGLGAKEASLANIGVSFFSFLGNFLSTFVVDRFGRRSLLLIVNSILLTLNFFVFGFLLSYHLIEAPALGYCLIATICLWIFCFGMAPGPIVFFIAPEMVSQRARSAAQSWTTVTQVAARGFCLAVYLPVSALIGPYIYAILFIVPLAVTNLAMFFYLPETKNRSLPEVHAAIEELPRFGAVCGRRRKVIPGEFLSADEKEVRFMTRF